MKPELVAWWKEGADLAEQHRADVLKLQKRRTALAKRTASVKSACGGGFRDGEACNCSLCPTCGQKLSKQPTTQENFALGSP
jgi:hypothetical protein